MKRLFIILAALALAACGSPTKVHFGDKDNPSRITSVEGLESHDAANVMSYAAYADTQVKKPQRAVCSFKAAAGKELKFEGLSEFTCWAPDTDTTAKPTQAKSTFERNADATGRVIEKATPLGAAALLVGDRKDARQAGLEATRIEAETIRQGNNLDAAYRQGVLDLLRDKIPDPDPTP